MGKLCCFEIGSLFFRETGQFGDLCCLCFSEVFLTAKYVLVYINGRSASKVQFKYQIGCTMDQVLHKFRGSSYRIMRMRVLTHFTPLRLNNKYISGQAEQYTFT